MVQRKIQGPAGPWPLRLAALPWWIGPALAALAYAVLHAIVPADALPAAPIHGPVGGAQISWRSVAGWGQYLLPILIIAGSLWQRWRNNTATAVGAARERTEGRATIGWREFDAALFKAFAQQGYQLVDAGDGKPEPGADRVLRKNRQSVLVGCKHWKVDKVSAAMVKAHCDTMAARGAEAGIVVCAGRFSREAIAYARLHNVKLIDGPILETLIGPAAPTK